MYLVKWLRRAKIEPNIIADTITGPIVRIMKGLFNAIDGIDILKDIIIMKIVKQGGDMKKVLLSISSFFILLGAQTLRITMPNGAEEWVVGNKHPIHWDWSGTITSVKLEYTTDAGTNWHLIASSTPNDGNYLWTIPNTQSANCFVKISDVSNPATNDLSDGSFAIVRPAIDIKKPDGGEVLVIGEYCPLHWDWTGQFSNVKIEYSTDNGSSWVQIIASTSNDGSHYWQVPNAPSTNCQVKITNLTDPTCFNISDNNFTIANNTITVIQPNGGETYTTGQVYPIYWDWTGSFANVKIDYSTDNGITWVPVVASTPNDGSYNWTIPNAPSNSCRIKVSNAADAFCFDISDDNFSILSTGLQLISPNGAETYTVGDFCPIHWDWIGTISSVRLEYSIDSGISWNLIIASTTNDGNYVWTVPDIDANATTCRIKVTNTADINCWDISDADFSVMRPWFTIFSPDSGKALVAGEIYPVHWNWQGTVSSVKLELWYKIAGGVNWWTISASTTNDGSHYFTVPYYISDSCGIKITSNDDPNCFALSEVFKIVRPTIKVVYPNAGEELTEGNKFEIIWDWNGNFASVQLQYSTDNANWHQIVASTPNDGSYLWTVPSGVWPNCWIKVINTADIDCYDVSDIPMNIIADTITVTRPRSADTFFIKRKHPIYWKWLGGFPTARIFYSSTGGLSWTIVTASTANTGYYLWTCDTFPSANALISVMSNLNSGTFDNSDLFVMADTSSLVQPLRVLAPLANDTFAIGGRCYITWHSQTFAPPDQVSLYYSIDGGPWVGIATVANGQKSYLWTVPNYVTNNCRIMVRDLNGSAFDISDSFSLVLQRIKIVSPTNDKEWLVGRKYFILWQWTGGFTNAVIDYSYDGGATWVSIASPTPNDGEYEWTIPNTPSTACLIRIRNYENSNVEVISDTFTIKPQEIFVSYPVESDSFIVGRKYFITWDYSGAFPSVNIDYSPDGGTSWIPVASGVANNQYYEWTVPNPPTNLAVVRVINSANLNAIGRSDTFSIIPQTIEVTSPALNNQWIVGRKYYITWRFTGAFPSVKLQYSSDNGNVWNTIIETSTNSGNYEWTIPNTPSDSCFVKVLNYTNLNVYDISARFRIPLQTITITSPKTGDNFIAGRRYYITWKWTGTMPQVDIQYSTNNGVSWHSVATGVPNNGSYEWTVPTVSSESCLVKLINPANPNVFDTSERFSILSQEITITSPVFEDILISGRKYYLTWRTKGSFSNANISYSLDGGQNWTSIATNVTNNGYYEWTMPEVISDAARIKIANSAQPMVFGASDTFTIAPPILALTSPALGNLWYAGRKYYITWNQLGGIQQVNLFYSLNGGGSWNPIVANQLNLGNYEWTIPAGTASWDARIRLVNSLNSSIAYISDSFAIGIVGIEELSSKQVPREFILQGFAPNPFTERAEIKFAIPTNAKIRLILYDVCGRIVEEIYEGNIEPGYHSFSYQAKLSCGIYFLRLEAQNKNEKVFDQVVKILKL